MASLLARLAVGLRGAANVSKTSLLRSATAAQARLAKFGPKLAFEIPARNPKGAKTRLVPPEASWGQNGRVDASFLVLDSI